MWNMQSTSNGLHFVLLFSVLCAALALCWLTFVFLTVSCEQRLYFLALLSSALISSSLLFVLFLIHFFSLNTSHHSCTSLPLQLLVGVTTQGRLVSSSPRGGRATTKTPWVVSGSLRPSQEAPSRSALTGSCDSSSATQLWKRCTFTDSFVCPHIVLCACIDVLRHTRTATVLSLCRHISVLYM